jgi:hypothetical protein
MSKTDKKYFLQARLFRVFLKSEVSLFFNRKRENVIARPLVIRGSLAAERSPKRKKANAARHLTISYQTRR